MKTRRELASSSATGIIVVSGESRDLAGPRGRGKKISYLEKERERRGELSRRNNGLLHPALRGIMCGPPLIRRTQSGIPLEGIRSGYRVSERCRGGGQRRRGYRRVRTRAIHYESTGRILSYQSLLVPSPLPPPPPHLPARRRPPSLPLYSGRYLPIYLSIGWMSESANQALMHAKYRGEINSHPPSSLFSHVFHARERRMCVRANALAHGWKNKFARLDLSTADDDCGTVSKKGCCDGPSRRRNRAVVRRPKEHVLIPGTINLPRP